MTISNNPISVELQDIAWDTVYEDGTRSSTLAGSRDPGVIFSYAFFIPAGVYDGPHRHSSDVHLTVAAGELRLGYGEKFDLAKTRGFSQGAFLWVPAGAAHFDGADQDTVIIGTAQGPWTTERPWG